MLGVMDSEIEDDAPNADSNDATPSSVSPPVRAIICPLAQLVEVLDKFAVDFKYELEQYNNILQPLIHNVLAGEAPDSDVARILHYFGWREGGFRTKVDLGKVANSLKAVTFQDVSELGKGAYATVYKARHRETREAITIKRLKFDPTDEGIPPTVLREVSLFKAMKHPNVVQMKDALLDGPRIFLVLEYLDMDLRQHMEGYQNGRVETVLMKSYVFQILLGLDHMHRRRMMHRDLKPQNILVDMQTRIIKLTDFGLARFYNPGRAFTQEVMTLWYRSPEVLLGCQKYGPAVDMWSVGCILAELVNGRPPFQGDSEIDQLRRIFQVTGTPSSRHFSSMRDLPGFSSCHFPSWPSLPLEQLAPDMSADGRDLLSRMLSLEPALRPTPRQAMSHPFFRDVMLPEAVQQHAAVQAVLLQLQERFF